ILTFIIHHLLRFLLFSCFLSHSHQHTSQTGQMTSPQRAQVDSSYTANSQGRLYISSVTATPGSYKVFNSEIYRLAPPNFELSAPVASFSLPNSTGWFPTNQIPNLLVSPLQRSLVLFNGSSNGAPLELVGLDPTTLKPLWYTKTP